MKRRVVIPILLAFFVAALVGPVALIVGTERGQAAFGDSESIGVNRLSSATVEVEIGPSSVVISGENLAPGDRAVGSIEILNTGTLPLRYAITSDMSADPLSAWLVWDIWKGSSRGTCDNAPTSIETLADGLAFRPAGGIDTPVVGDVAVGLDPGDRILEPGAAETLCVAVVLDLQAPDSVQNRRVEQQFTVVAEQHTDGLAP